MNESEDRVAAWLGSGSINIFGSPFSGKDTQGDKLADIFHGVLVAGGDILRSHHDPERITQIMAEGGLIPSDFYFSLLLPFLSQPKFKGKPLVLSSVGRRKGEETVILKAAKESGHPIVAAILLDMPEDVVWRRFEKAAIEHDRDGRADDRREVLKNRLRVFRDQTMPVIDFYRKKDLLIEVDGGQSRDEVTKEIIEKLRLRACFAGNLC